MSLWAPSGAPLYGPDWVTPAIEGFYVQAFNGSVALPVAGYNYNSNWIPLLRTPTR